MDSLRSPLTPDVRQRNLRHIAVQTSRHFQLRILGEHFHIPVSDPENPSEAEPACGFVTTRWIEAPSPLHAAIRAFTLVRAQVGAHHQPQAGSGPLPQLTVVEIWEVDSFEKFPAPGTGFTFFGPSPPPSHLARCFTQIRALWQRIRRDHPWTYSEPF